MMTENKGTSWKDGKTLLYMYRLASDAGLAPCVSPDNLLTLACCKGGKFRNNQAVNTGIRYWIGKNAYGANWKTDNVFVLGTYKDKFLYLARITNVMTMAEYYSGASKGRLDDIYKCVDKETGELKLIGKLKDNNGAKIHGDTDQQRKDKAGVYVLMSDDYVYLGKESDNTDEIPELMRYGPKRQETKRYEGPLAREIIDACMKYKDRKDGKPHVELKRSGGCR